MVQFFPSESWATCRPCGSTRSSGGGGQIVGGAALDFPIVRPPRPVVERPTYLWQDEQLEQTNGERLETEAKSAPKI